MKKSLSLLIIAIIALTSSINASAQWTDRNTFGLIGPVKEVYDYNNGDLSFDEDGKIIYEEDPQIYWARIDRDDYGRITYLSRVYFSYNSKGQVESTTCSGGGGFSESKFIYNTNGQVIKEIETGEAAGIGKHTTITTYTYQECDPYGNWIMRTAKTGKKRTVESRMITYHVSQSSSIPKYIKFNWENYHWEEWIAISDSAKVLEYKITDWENIQGELQCDKWWSMSDIRPKKLIYGEKRGNYIYDIVADAGIIYAYNAADFSKSFTKSNYIPLKYGGNKGTKLDNGATMYVVPFKAGKYSVIGSIDKKQLTGTYVLIIRHPYNSEYNFPAVVNIKKTPEGYDLSNAYAMFPKNDKAPGYVISTSGQLLKSAITLDNGDCTDECYFLGLSWIFEYNGLCSGGYPLGAVSK